MALYGSNASGGSRLLSALLGDRVVAFHPSLARALGGINEALFVQQILFWSARVPPERQGWIWKEAAEITAETCLSWDQQKRVRAKLIAMRVLEERRMRAPENRIYFRCDLGRLEELLMVDGVATSAPPPPPDPLPVPPVPEVKPPGKARPRLFEAPATFTVADRDYKWAAEKGLDRAALDLATEAFLANARAKGLKYADWHQAWQTWVIRQATDFGRRVPVPLRQAATNGAAPAGLEALPIDRLEKLLKDRRSVLSDLERHGAPDWKINGARTDVAEVVSALETAGVAP